MRNSALEFPIPLNSCKVTHFFRTVQIFLKENALFPSKKAKKASIQYSKIISLNFNALHRAS